jgi:hypothetical protein
MATKLQIEFDGKPAEIEIASPPWGMRAQMLKYGSETMKKVLGMQAKLKDGMTSMSAEDVELGTTQVLEEDNKLDELMVSLMRAGPVKTVEDVQKMGADDVLRIHDWIKAKLGLTKEKAMEGFTRT